MPGSTPPAAPLSIFIGRVPLFSGLSAAELNFISARAQLRRFEAGQVIFLEGQPCEGLYVVSSGRIKIFKTSAAGREHILNVEAPGAIVAELPVFDGGDYPASAAALTEATLLFIRKQDIYALCLEHPEVSLKVLRSVGGRLRHLVEIIEELSFGSVRARLASLLLRLAEREGKPTPQGVHLTMPFTTQELAAQIGTVRELVSRNLSRLQAMGIIRMEGREVTIPDLGALKQEAEASE